MSRVCGTKVLLYLVRHEAALLDASVIIFQDHISYKDKYKKRFYTLEVIQ